MFETTLTPEPEDTRNWLVFFGGLTLLTAAFALLVLWGPLFNPLSSSPTVAEADTSFVLPAGGGPLLVDGTAYEIALTTVDGDDFRLSPLIGQPVVLNFWASWCGPCRLEAPNLQAAHEQYGDDGLQLIGINQDEPVAAAQGFVDEFAWTFPSLLDEGAATARNYGVFGTLPVTIFINRDGVVTNLHRGPITSGQLDEYVAIIMSQ